MSGNLPDNMKDVVGKVAVTGGMPGSEPPAFEGADVPLAGGGQTGRQMTTAEKLACDERVAFFSFIGSGRVGWMLRSKLAAGTRCALEHGGVAPVIIADDADLDDAIPLIAKAGFYHAGQVCVSVQRVYAPATMAGQVAYGLPPEQPVCLAQASPGAGPFPERVRGEGQDVTFAEALHCDERRDVFAEADLHQRGRSRPQPARAIGRLDHGLRVAASRAVRP